MNLKSETISSEMVVYTIIIRIPYPGGMLLDGSVEVRRESKLRTKEGENEK